MKELLLKNSRLDGRYDITESLGQGSYAEIYVARDILASPHAPHSVVVIKALNVFLQDDLDEDLEKTLVKNFQNEAVALDRVRHPNVISRLGHGTARDLQSTVFHYLVLEFLPGGDLAKLRKSRDFSLAQSFDFLEQTCAGLAHAHERGIIHRDIKPQNLLLTGDLKTIKIADFGVARLSEGDSPVTRVGTNMYAPPEHSPIINDTHETLTVSELTPAADVYSLAKSAYAIITGDSPRRFTNAPIMELHARYAGKSWSADLLAVLSKATQNAPRERFQSVQDFWRELVKVKLKAETENLETDSETQVLTKPHFVPQPSVSKDYSPQPPALPKFDTARNIKVDAAAMLASQANPRIVINLGKQRAPADSRIKTPDARPSVKITAHAPAQSAAHHSANQTPEFVPIPAPKMRPFMRRMIYFLLFAAFFSGAIFATQSYLRSGSVFPQIVNPFVAPEAVALNDINLRAGAGVENDLIGVVPKGSLVKIRQSKVLDDKSTWSEIEITEFSRDKTRVEDATRGWVNSKYLDMK